LPGACRGPIQLPSRALTYWTFTEEIFRPFAQFSAERTGLGLGLPISRRGVEANGGTLHVRNLPGTGCVFTIDLPRAAPPLA
jgi:signal transduction histidine kinase